MVLAAIDKVYVSDFYFSDKVFKALLYGISNKLVVIPAKISEHGLSDHEIDVLRLIFKEYTTAEIGETLFLSPRTIEGYRKVLMEKTSVRNMAGLVCY